MSSLPRSRLRLLLIGVLAACTGPRAPAPVIPLAPAPDTPRTRYEPTSGRYVIEERIRREQDFGGRTQPTAIHRRAFLEAEVHSLTREPRPLEILITVDSLVADPGSSVPGTNLSSLYESARGLVFRALLEQTSDLLALTGGDTTSQVSQELEGLLRHLFPRIPEHGVAPGETWTDSTSAVTHAARIALEVQGLAQHRVTGWIVIDGSEVLEILTNEVYEVSGSGTQVGQEVTLTGRGVRDVRTLLDRAGLLHAREASDSVSMEVHVVSAGMSVPVIQTTKTSTRRRG